MLWGIGRHHRYPNMDITVVIEVASIPDFKAKKSTLIQQFFKG